MSACAVCDVRTFKTREPLAKTCSACGKALCHAHAHFYVDGQNVAITRAAPPKCATCFGLEGFTVIGIEKEADYLPLIEQRITKPLQVSMFGDWEEAS